VALTKDLAGGTLHREARSAKDLMVRPYLPRFLRTGDEAELKVVVNNAGKKPLRGDLRLELYDAETGKSQVKALIYVSGVAPDAGESASTLVGKFPGSTLGPTLAPPVILADGSKDLYIRQDKYHAQFAADVSLKDSMLMAATQRPITEAALNESGDIPAWKTIPSWFLYGSLDKNIPPAVHAFMAKRAGAKRAVEVKGASHVVMISHPEALVALIDEAAAQAR